MSLPDPALPWVGFFLFVLAYVFLPFELVYAQSNLNRLWRRVAETEGGSVAT